MRTKIIALIHAVIVITTFWAVGAYMFSTDVLGSVGLSSLKYFTTDSNILAAVGSLIYLLLSGKKKPAWATRFRFAGTVSVTLTLLTVIFFLAPVAAVKGGGMTAYLRFFEGNVFVLHFSTPVLSVIAFLLDRDEEGLTKRDVLWGLVPVAVYAAVYALMVAVLKRWYDWYGFTFGGNFGLIPIVLAVIGVVTALIGWSLLKLGKRVSGKA